MGRWVVSQKPKSIRILFGCPLYHTWFNKEVRSCQKWKDWKDMDPSIDSFIRVAVNFFFGLYILEIISFIFFFFSYLEWKSTSQAREFLFILACPLKCRLREFWRLIIIYMSTEIFGWYFYLQNSTYMTTVLPWVFSWVIFNVVLKFTVANN